MWCDGPQRQADVFPQIGFYVSKQWGVPLMNLGGKDSNAFVGVSVGTCIPICFQDSDSVWAEFVSLRDTSWEIG